MNNKQAHCYSCKQLVTLHVTSQDFTDGSRHLRGSCPLCRRWIKWVPWDEPRFYVGKYAGQTIRDVTRKDPSYAQWALDNLRLSTASREVLREEEFTRSSHA